ncbi:MAG: hypothetical protein HRU07_09820 [Nitrosopumilus sp.]|nr:PKD domain-containing protein [Nitrosopumilus sp.]NRA06424.1 hypothetical protein [Nitrosopumilus sp.]
MEKQQALDKALKVRDDRLARISEEEKEKYGETLTTPQSIIAAWRTSQASSGPGLLLQDEIEEETVVEVIVNYINIKTYLSVPHFQEWKKVLRYDVLVTDDSGHRYDSSYEDYIGNKQSDVSISGTIKDPSSTVIQSFSGITDNSGKYLGTYLIPDRITTNGEYTISIDAVKTFSDNTITTASDSDVFFVFPSDSGGASNQAPVSNAGPDQSSGNPFAVTLDGSGSTDPDNDVLTYLWTQISGVTQTLTGDTTTAPTFTSTGTGTFVFQLAVTDVAGLVSTDSVTITAT